jgi:hypothetical protein
VIEIAEEGAERPTLALRTGRWKFIRREGRPDELYDLAADPGELTDLVAGGLVVGEEEKLGGEVGGQGGDGGSAGNGRGSGGPEKELGGNEDRKGADGGRAGSGRGGSGGREGLGGQETGKDGGRAGDGQGVGGAGAGDAEAAAVLADFRRLADQIEERRGATEVRQIELDRHQIEEFKALGYVGG